MKKIFIALFEGVSKGMLRAHLVFSAFLLLFFPYLPKLPYNWYGHDERIFFWCISPILYWLLVAVFAWVQRGFKEDK